MFVIFHFVLITLYIGVVLVQRNISFVKEIDGTAELIYTKFGNMAITSVR